MNLITLSGKKSMTMGLPVRIGQSKAEQAAERNTLKTVIKKYKKIRAEGGTLTPSQKSILSKAKWKLEKLKRQSAKAAKAAAEAAAQALKNKKVWMAGGTLLALGVVYWMYKKRKK